MHASQASPSFHWIALLILSSSSCSPPRPPWLTAPTTWPAAALGKRRGNIGVRPLLPADPGQLLLHPLLQHYNSIGPVFIYYNKSNQFESSISPSNPTEKKLASPSRQPKTHSTLIPNLCRIQIPKTNTQNELTNQLIELKPKSLTTRTQPSPITQADHTPRNPPRIQSPKPKRDSNQNWPNRAGTASPETKPPKLEPDQRAPGAYLRGSHGGGF